MKKDLVQFVRAISEPKRLMILNRLKEERCVGELWKCLKLTQNLTSHHLGVLRAAKLIKRQRQGLKLVYRLDDGEIEKNLKKLKDYIIKK